MNKVKKCLVISIFVLSLLGCSSDINPSKLTEQGQKSMKKEEVVSISNVTFHVLLEEYLETDDENNPDVTVLYRVYDVFQKGGSSLKVHSVAIPETDIETMEQAKSWMVANHSEGLQLEPLTIVSANVFNQWKSEGYQAIYEYWDGSPEGLTFDLIKKGK